MAGGQGNAFPRTCSTLGEQALFTAAENMPEQLFTDVMAFQLKRLNKNFHTRFLQARGIATCFSIPVKLVHGGFEVVVPLMEI